MPHFAHSWRAALAQDGSLRLQLTKGENVCTPAEDREVWDRVDAGSPVGDYLLAVTEGADWQAAPSYLWLGLYVAPETGHVLEVADNGTYRYYETLDTASMVAADRGELDTASGTTTGSCRSGSFSGDAEVAQVPGVKGYVSAYDAVRITNATGSCASGIAEQGVWVNIAR